MNYTPSCEMPEINEDQVNKKMKTQIRKIIIALFIFAVFLPISIISGNNNAQKPRPSGKPLLDTIISGSWSAISQESWCNGSGTASDPYVIFGAKFESNSTDYSLKIENSNAHAIITGCTFRNTKKGIHLDNCQNIIIKNNDFNKGLSYGIYIENCQLVKVVDNRIKAASVSGIHVVDTTFMNLTDNIANCCKYGVYMKHSTASNVSRNIGNFSTASGFQLYDCSGMNVRQNHFCNNTRDGILLWNSEKTTINHNTLCGNAEYGIRIYSSNNNTVRNNTLLHNGAANVTQMKGSMNNEFYGNYWGQARIIEDENPKADVQSMVMIGLLALIIGALSLGAVISYKYHAKNHVFTIKGSEKHLECPKCGERKKAFIQKGVDEKNILYRYPSIVYGNYYQCQRCGTRWRYKQSK